ncbi:MAG: exosome complex RNA-binding protein Csl4 [Thermoprotei archaeon]
MSSIVVPGESVGVAEEYVPDGNVVEDNGILRSLVVGSVQKNDEKHTVSVSRLSKGLMLPEKGEILYGVVTDVKPKMVSLDIVSSSDKPFANPFLGLLPVSMIDERRVETAEECFIPGDVVLCKVVSEKPPYVVSTKSPDLGVIKASCRECGSELQLGPGGLVCALNHHSDTRKLSSKFTPTTEQRPVTAFRHAPRRERGPERRTERYHGNRRMNRYGDRRKKFG